MPHIFLHIIRNYDAERLASYAVAQWEIGCTNLNEPFERIQSRTNKGDMFGDLHEIVIVFMRADPKPRNSIFL